MTGLRRREWIEAGDGGYVLTDAGYAVRGAISGLLRKRLGLNVVLTLNAASERVYRIG